MHLQLRLNSSDLMISDFTMILFNACHTSTLHLSEATKLEWTWGWGNVRVGQWGISEEALVFQCFNN